MRRMPVPLHYLNGTMNTGDEGTALHKRNKTDKVVLIFSTLVAGTSTDSVDLITLFAVLSATANPACELSALRIASGVNLT